MYKINRKQKSLIKIYIALFIVMFFVINWDTVSWVFNYRVMSGLIGGFFSPYPESALLASATGIALEPQLPSPAPEIKKAYPYSPKANSIEITTIDIEAPIVIGQTTDIKTITKDLDRGVVYYPGSVLPGENGHIILLGHSAPPNWPKIKYDWVFSKVNDLNPGDEVSVHFNNTKYTYRVTEKAIIQPGDNVVPKGLTGKNNILTIISCWPPGKDYKRIAVQAELIAPSEMNQLTQSAIIK